MFADPFRVGGKIGRQTLYAVAEARIRHRPFLVEMNALALAEQVERAGLAERRCRHRDQALAALERAADLPFAIFGAYGFRSQHEYDGVGFKDEREQPLLPLLSTGYAVDVEQHLMAERLDDGFQLLGEDKRILAAIGDEDLQPGCARHCHLRNSAPPAGLRPPVVQRAT